MSVTSRVSLLCSADLCTSSPQTAEELESRSKLLRLLDSVIDALVWAISKLGLTTQQQTLRLGHLTLLLSHIRHVRWVTFTFQNNTDKRLDTLKFGFHKKKKLEYEVKDESIQSYCAMRLFYVKLCMSLARCLCSSMFIKSNSHRLSSDNWSPKS